LDRLFELSSLVHLFFTAGKHLRQNPGDDAACAALALKDLVEEEE
jgi:hypothetical protein